LPKKRGRESLPKIAGTTEAGISRFIELDFLELEEGKWVQQA
jgi:hypothetical protein